MVTVFDVLRPISYVDELEGLVDALWLCATRQRLEEYATLMQNGGRTEHLLVVLGLLVALQSRKALGLPTLVEVADLSRGYELVWRDALRLHLQRAGIGGRMWLVAELPSQR